MSDLDWVAGFIDGEGCIGLYRCDFTFQPILKVSQKDKSLLEIVQGILQAGHFYKDKNSIWVLTIQKFADLERILTVLPLRHPRKKKNAQLLLEYLQLRKTQPNHGFHHPREEEIYWETKQKVYIQGTR
jgi:hypothetical protein